MSALDPQYVQYLCAELAIAQVSGFVGARTFDVLGDRRLALVMIPPKSLEADVAAGDSAAITVVDSDAIDWRIRGTRGGNGGGERGVGDGRERHARAGGDETDDHERHQWPLQPRHDDGAGPHRLGRSRPWPARRL